jgi:H2-forming N5,N10-methylenetetrahydromethanopterin dehydrogenase-like enzyme
MTMFSVPTSTATEVLANVSSTLADTGFLTILVVAAAIPLVFYVARQIIGLIPKARGRRQ